MKSSAVRRVVVATTTLLAAVSITTPAFATTETFMSGQNLGAKNAKSSGWVDSYWSWTDGNSDHTWCPGVGRGYSGYTSTPTTGGNTTKVSSSCSGWGYKSIGPGSLTTIDSTQNWRGAVYNPNNSTTDYFSSARAAWQCSDFGC